MLCYLIGMKNLSQQEIFDGASYLALCPLSGWLSDEAGKIVLTNAYAARELPSIKVGETLQAIIHSQERDYFQHIWDAADPSTTSRLLRLVSGKGFPFSIKIRVIPSLLPDGQIGKAIEAVSGDSDAYLEQILHQIAGDLALVEEDHFLDAFVSALGKYLQKEQVLVGGLSKDKTLMRAISLWYKGELIHTASYKLMHTPCENVINEGALKCYLQNVQQHFPLDQDLVDWESQSYVGYPLVEKDGTVTGHIATISEQVLTETEGKLAAAVLKAYAPRVVNYMVRRGTQKSFQSLFNHNPTGVVFGEQGSSLIQLANPAFARMLGYEPGELDGLKISEITHHEDHQYHKKVNEASGAKKISDLGPFVKRYIHRDGHLVYGEVSVRMIDEEPGMPPFHIVMVRDVTRELETERQLATQQGIQTALMAEIPDGIIVLDHEGIVMDINANFVNGYKKVYGIELKPSDAFKDFPDWHFWDAGLKRIWEEGKAFSFETEIEIEGSFRSLINVFSPIRGSDQEIIGAAAFFRDVTKVRESERDRLRDLRRFDQVFNNSAIGWVEFDMSQPAKQIMEMDLPEGMLVEDYFAKYPDRIPNYLGEFKACNHRFLQMVGANSETEFIQTRRDIYGEDLNDFLFREVSHIRSGGGELEMEIPIRHLDGSPRHLYLWIKYPTDGDYSSVIYGGLDITEQKRIESALRQNDLMLRQMSDTISDLIFIYDLEESHIVFSNHDLAQFIDKHDSSIALDKGTLAELVHPDDRAYMLRTAQRLIEGPEGESVEMELRVGDEADGYIWFSTMLKGFKRSEEGFVTQILGVGRNVNARKQIEESLRQTNSELKRYIDSNMQLENFAYIASHDLKEPLRTIGSFAQLLSRRYTQELDEQGQSYLEFINQGAGNLNVLIDDLLLYSQVVEGARKVEMVNLNQILKQVIYQLGSKVKETEAQITYGNMPNRILASPSQMVQVFQNLIANAIKFARPDTPPLIQIRGRQANKGWQIQISDNGIGIDAEFHETVFLLFKKLHTREHYEGTGIGLALVKKIIEEHGGRIEIESAIGKGTTFSLWLPDRQ